MHLHITVKPGSKTDEFSASDDNGIRVKIKVPPIDGKANDYLRKYLAKIFSVSPSSVQILKGHTSSHKKISIDVADKHLLNILAQYKTAPSAIEK